MSTKKKTAILLSTAGLIAGSAILPASASAAVTECEPGYVSTTFNHAAVANSEVVAGSVTLTNASGVDAPVSASVSHTTTVEASVTGSVSFESIVSPLQAEISATATASQTWTAGSALGPMTVPAGQSYIATYGFNQVSFSGSQRSCQLDGMFGPETYFSGTAPTGIYFKY